MDTDGDGKIDQWTEWQTVTESYQRKPGFSKIIEATPATLDLSSLPKARTIEFEIKLDGTGKAKPEPEKVELFWK
ncbi:MAG: hypothetical protein R3C11_15655 [Planctomycetaceae bacterium]